MILTILYQIAIVDFQLELDLNDVLFLELCILDLELWRDIPFHLSETMISKVIFLSSCN